MQTAGKKRYLREFDIEELLFRKPIAVNNEKTAAYYRDKVILITGGGGSIGSELCRQLAKMEPKQRYGWTQEELGWRAGITIDKKSKYRLSLRTLYGGKPVNSEDEFVEE